MSLTKVSYSMITGAPVNILDFGADPTGINDSAPAIQAAIDFANTANQTGTVPFGFARTTVVFPAGVYLCKSTLTFVPFVNYVGTRATTFDNTAPPDYSDTRGSMLIASVDIYNNNPATAGVLVYVYTGDITIENIGFVGTGGLTSNSSIGIQWGSTGTGRPFEVPGASNVSGVLMSGSRLLSFTKGFEACSLNDAYFYTVGIENCTTAINWSSNVITNNGQSAEFHGCTFFQHAVGWTFNNALTYTIRMFGGQFYRFQPNGQHVTQQVPSGAPNLFLTFHGVEFGHGSDTNTNHFLMLGNYDGALNMINCVGCTFTGSTVKLSRNAGTASFSNWIFNSCNFIGVTVNLDITDKGQILGGNFYNSKVTMSNSQYITIKDVTFFGLSGVGIDVTNGNCGFNYFSGNTFISVSTPIQIFNNSNNDTIFMENNLGVTSSPTRGKIVDNRTGIVFANLGTPANGSVVYCPDGTIANPVAGGGSGCIAKRLNGVWIGN
jgi:hypothetical protein